MSQNIKRRGFTLIELMIAMTFVSMLLIAITMTVIQISHIYNRGMVLKNTNQMGRSIVDELKRGIASSNDFDIENTADYVNKDFGGRLCMGKYSYIFNFGKSISDPMIFPNLYSSGDKIEFAKIYDPVKAYCKSDPDGNYNNVEQAKAIDLFNDSQYNLVLHSFSINLKESASDYKTGQHLYNIEFSIGTNNQTALTDTDGVVNCTGPGLEGSDLDYCSVIKFNITARSGSTTN